MSKNCPHCHQPMPEPHNIICHDDSRCVMYDGKVSDPLTRKEYEVMTYLVKNYGRYCSAESIADWIYQNDMDPPLYPLPAVCTYLTHLRHKLRSVGLTVTNLRDRRPTGHKIERIHNQSQDAA
jgi:DNA-binding response OmpR family regulator